MITAVLLALLSFPGIVSPVTLPEPVGFWQFTDELQGKDLSGYQNHPTLNGITYIEGPNGENSAYDLAGTSSSYIRIPNNGALDTSSYTVVMQLMMGTTTGPVFEWIFDENDHSLWSTHIWIYPNSDDFYIWLTDTNNNGDVSFYEADAFTPGEWTFAVVTFDYATGETILWKDGVHITSQTMGANFLQRLNNDVTIGVSQINGETRHWDGNVACYQFYDKALSQEEILEAHKLCSKQGLKSKKESKFVLVKDVEVGFGLNSLKVKTTANVATYLECQRLCLHDVTCHLINFMVMPDSKICEMSDYKYESLQSDNIIDRGAGCKMYKRVLVY